LLVDSFSTRGYAKGFPARSYDERPDAVNEVTIRPLDAYGALAYLRTRGDVDSRLIALQGWSNGGSATLATMADVTLQRVGLSAGQGFAGAAAFYPACGLHGQFDAGYRPYAPVRVFSGDDDEEVSAAHCKRLVDASRARGAPIAIAVYPGATHDFDDPGAKRQSVEANASARSSAIAGAQAFLASLFAAAAASKN
jgi:dienelactone hydrolase